MSRGRFVTLEGGEGAGKTTQSALLAEALAARGVAVLRTREPGGSPGAELLRGVLLGGSVDWAPRAETLLHFAARAEHVAKTIEPALQAGTWVVCDRFFDSTMAYQGYGQGADRGFIASLIGLLGIAPGPDDRARCRRNRSRRSGCVGAAATPTAMSGWMRPSMPVCGRAFERLPRRTRSAACCWTPRGIFRPSTPPS